MFCWLASRGDPAVFCFAADRPQGARPSARVGNALLRRVSAGADCAVSHRRERETLLSFLALALADRAACTLLYALLFVPLRREKRSKKEKRKPRAEEFFDLQGEGPSLSEQPNKPAMVRCYAEEDRVSVEKDVRLGHIFSVLERLKDLPLGAGDRLETEKFREMLEVYRAKGDLTAKEAETLNDILASLLKMMAKYDV